MAAVKTTTTAALTPTDSPIKLAATTGVADGTLIRVDSEVMRVTAGFVSGQLSVPVIRGWDGTQAVAHVTGANAIIITPTDTPTGGQAPTIETLAPYKRAIVQYSYSASGAIANPPTGNDARVFLNGTGALAMTLSNPGAEQDGDVMEIIGNGKAAHTVTYTAGMGAGGSAYDVFTFNSGAQEALRLVAASGSWIVLGPVAGTVTAIAPAIA